MHLSSLVGLVGRRDLFGFLCRDLGRCPIASGSIYGPRPSARICALESFGGHLVDCVRQIASAFRFHSGRPGPASCALVFAFGLVLTPVLLGRVQVTASPAFAKPLQTPVLETVGLYLLHARILCFCSSQKSRKTPGRKLVVKTSDVIDLGESLRLSLAGRRRRRRRLVSARRRSRRFHQTVDPRGIRTSQYESIGFSCDRSEEACRIRSTRCIIYATDTNQVIAGHERETR